MYTVYWLGRRDSIQSSYLLPALAYSLVMGDQPGVLASSGVPEILHYVHLVSSGH